MVEIKAILNIMTLKLIITIKALTIKKIIWANAAPPPCPEASTGNEIMINLLSEYC